MRDRLMMALLLVCITLSVTLGFMLSDGPQHAVNGWVVTKAGSDELRDLERDLWASDVNYHRYSEAYDCTEYTYDLFNELRGEYDVCPLEIEYVDDGRKHGHMMLDVMIGGTIYSIEPQYDRIYRLHCGDAVRRITAQGLGNITKLSSCHRLEVCADE